MPAQSRVEAEFYFCKSSTNYLEDSPTATAMREGPEGRGDFFFFFFFDSYEDMRICSFLPPHWSLPRNKEHSLAKLMLALKVSGSFFCLIYLCHS